ncbi:(2E,6E)-farnesyl diphosphate synthase [Aliiglaciecola sp. CAU 1673]|uniref:(2E,6E)-farnesyl diphosphate synthase n=1 Tax=Aliiglaciecola sp. CAU 1673 TaxID=3032595 RepID=UPI0023DB93B3|nr:(2E,6E)-farnesyl diphosphate synthase [Aliiglaciecola sp. CAU 1673]MDF2178025.1 (2E,6E)-farnesyl diphosphate synthase [Aliiglaciecola sp. CAU 1673]
MMSEQWQSAHSAYLQRINKLLQQHVNTLPDLAPQLKAAMEYALLIGGKRVRPALLYAAGEMLNVAIEDLDGPAMALECIHAYSLVHDDLPAMDNDDLRRGKPTCHIAFDEATAILAADALQTLAFEILAEYPLRDRLEDRRIRLVRYLAKASGYQGMCGGQALDLAATNKVIDLVQLETLHQHKTGALLKAALQMAACMSDCATETQTKLHQFADAIGLAFQVQDDILDITSDTQTLGKRQGADLELNKSTYPALLGLSEAKVLAQQLYQQALQALQGLPYNTAVLQSFAGYIVNRNH